jgi:hypothetical protein
VLVLDTHGDDYDDEEEKLLLSTPGGRIPAGLLFGLPRLRVLRLENNGLRSVCGYEWGSPNLELLYLGGNHIQFIETDCFEHLPNLQVTYSSTFSNHCGEHGKPIICTSLDFIEDSRVRKAMRGRKRAAGVSIHDTMYEKCDARVTS